MNNDPTLHDLANTEQNGPKSALIISDLTCCGYCRGMSDDIDKLRQEIKDLRRDLAVLTAKHESLRQDCDRGVTSLLKLHDQAWEFCTRNHRNTNEAFERVIHLELTVFPNLQSDMDDVYRITGEEDPRENPLDRRKPPPK